MEHDGEYSRILMLHKFFNLNQCIAYLYEDLSPCQIKAIQDKRDGSMIRFLRLPNGEIIAKTKMDFNNAQTALANRLLSEDKGLYDFVSESFLCLLFEKSIT